MHHPRSRDQPGEDARKHPAENISTQITDQKKSAAGLSGMFKKSNRIQLGQVVKKQIADDHVVLPGEGISNRILTESIELDAERSSPFGSVAQGHRADVTSMQVQIELRSSRTKRQTDRNVTGPGCDVQHADRFRSGPGT